MQTGVIQPRTENTHKSVPRMRSLLPYTLVVFAGCAAVLLLGFFAGRGPDGAFDPMALKNQLDAMPRCLHSGLVVVMLAFVAVEFDFIGRFLSFPIARIAFAGTVTRRRLAVIRFVILSALLALMVLGMVLGFCPAPRGWFIPVFFGVLLAPIILSGAEWIRSQS